MKTTIIIQARMNSTRLPGKVMKKIGGTPIINLIIKRLSRAKLVDDIIVATSKIKENQILINYLKKNKIKLFCGSESDVLSRFYKAATKNKSKIIVRITADCPFIDPKIVDEFIYKFKKNKVDYLSNNNPWTYPDGMDVEVFSYDLLKKANKLANKRNRLNGGVLVSFLKENKRYKIKNIKCSIKNVAKYRLTIDEEVDYKLLKKIYEHFSPNIHFSFTQIINFAKKNNKLFKLNSSIKLNEGSFISKSQKLWKRANSIILGGNSLISKNPNVFLPNGWPTYFVKSKGCNIWDLNNKKLIDMSLMGVGTNILGYCNTEVDKAVKKNIDFGNMTTLNCPEEVHLAEKLISMHDWADKVKFARTGGEANTLAIRIARAAAAKENIAFCGYHGWHDWYLSANLKNNSRLDTHLIPGLEPVGVPKSLKNTSFGFNYGDYKKLEQLVREKNIGIIKMEVARNKEPDIKFLKKVRNLATKKNIVLIFDECTTGFRQFFGGLHQVVNIVPDIAIYGKALGNGYAITAVIGKDSVMEKAKDSFMSSTFWTERIGPTAALKTLEIMERDKTWIRITNLGNKLIKIWKKIALRNNLKIKIFGLPTLAKFSIESTNFQAYKTFITQEMLKKGFLAANGVYISCSHNEKILKKYEEVLDEIFFNISKCERKELNIYDILNFPVSRVPFGRLN
jgi:glutamate-1-semialdehyde 2,1-aminomutase